ncbi:MAG: CvpA family protein [Mariniblastus sp.]
MLILIGILIFVLCIASTWWFGLWSNAITLVNLLLSAMLASSIYEPVSIQLRNINSSYRVLYDFIAVWLVFIVAFLILRGITDTLSGYRLKFDPATELIGRSVLSIWIACVFVCFTFFTLQMAPLAPSFYSTERQSRENLGTIPDRAWLSFIQSRSRGALATSKKSSMFNDYRLAPHPDDVDKDMRVFDPHADFLMRYQNYRWELSEKSRLMKR